MILHLLPGCSTPASCSPKGCMGRHGSQTQRSPNVANPSKASIKCWTLLSPQCPAPASSALLQPVTTWTGQNHPAEILFFRFYFKVSHVLPSVLCGAVISVHRNTQLAHDPRCQKLYENSFSEKREYGK